MQTGTISSAEQNVSRTVENEDPLVSKGEVFIKMDKLYSLRKYHYYPESGEYQTRQGLRVRYTYEPILSIEFITAYLQEMVTKGETDTKTLIVYDVLEISLKKLAYLTQFIHFEAFQAVHLDILLKGHRWLPTISILSDEEASKITAMFGARIPFIMKDDPLVVLYELKPGEMIFVHRIDESVSYRMVCDST